MFTTPCDLRVLKNHQYQLLSNLVFNDGKLEIIVYKGFVWNLASIPRVLWEETGCPMDFVMESCLHDVLYASAVFDRETADKYWYLALRSGGRYKEPVSKLKAKVLHAGVRLGGGNYYRVGDVSKAREFVHVRVVK